MGALRKVLIANRGEIAVRVARTCRAMGLPTVAVYSPVDRGALHTRVTDFALEIPGYLDIDALVAAARRAGADAVHPGYGFLSQNGDFADACAEAGLIFIGPPGDVHRLMGDKKAARRQVQRFGGPVVPGYDGDEQDEGRLLAEAKRIHVPAEYVKRYEEQLKSALEEQKTLRAEYDRLKASAAGIPPPVQ